jgi:molecular chaperone GrpE (heat shock protein)
MLNNQTPLQVYGKTTYNKLVKQEKKRLKENKDNLTQLTQELKNLEERYKKKKEILNQAPFTTLKQNMLKSKTMDAFIDKTYSNL